MKCTLGVMANTVRSALAQFRVSLHQPTLFSSKTASSCRSAELSVVRFTRCVLRGRSRSSRGAVASKAALAKALKKTYWLPRRFRCCLTCVWLRLVRARVTALPSRKLAKSICGVTAPMDVLAQDLKSNITRPYSWMTLTTRTLYASHVALSIPLSSQKMVFCTHLDRTNMVS